MATPEEHADFFAKFDRLAAEGAQAYHDGKGRDACPYAKDTFERSAWLDGYEDPY